MFVVTLPARAAHQPAAFARRAQAAGAQVLEIRGDLTPGLAPFETPLPLLVAPRGARPADVRPDWVARLAPAYLDLELDEPGEHGPGCPDARRIRSFHDHARTPSLGDLRSVIAALDRTGAEILKLATRVHDDADLATLEHLQLELGQIARLRGRTVVLGMGLPAWPNRLLSPWRNALTYACLDDEAQAAPGQIPLRTYAACRPPTT